MKDSHSIIAALIALIAMLSGPAACRPKPVKPAAVKEITVTDAVALLARDQSGFTVLDVRTPQEYNEGHIAGAANLDFKSSTFRDRLAALSRERTYLVHCASGGRSSPTVKLMEELGFTRVYHMEAGFDSWKGEGRPVVGAPALEEPAPR